MRSAIEREKRQARGIVIRHGAYLREPSAFWAYLWSEEMSTDDPRIVSHESRVTSGESRVTSRDTMS